MKKNNSKKSTKVFSGIICTILSVIILWTVLYFTVPKVKEWTNEKFHISANKGDDDEEKKALIEENKQLKTRIDDLESNVTKASSKYDSVSEKLKETEEKLATANAKNESLENELAQKKATVETATFTSAADLIDFLFVQGKAKDVIDVRLTDTSYTGAPKYYEKAVQTATETTFETTVESYTVTKLNEYILTPARTTSNSIKFTVSTTATTLELYCQQSGNIQILVRDIKVYSDNITTISATFYNVQETLNQFTVRYFA